MFFFPAASNILICRSGSCHCADIFCCECPVESKCEIRISDFDSVKLFSRGLSATSVPDVACKAKADTTKVLGTPYYRAPEVIKLYLVYTRTYMYTLTHVHVHALYVYNHVHVCTHNSYLPVIGVHETQPLTIAGKLQQTYTHKHMRLHGMWWTCNMITHGKDNSYVNWGYFCLFSVCGYSVLVFLDLHKLPFMCILVCVTHVAIQADVWRASQHRGESWGSVVWHVGNWGHHHTALPRQTENSRERKGKDTQVFWFSLSICLKWCCAGSS